MIEGEWAGRVTGLGDQRVEIAMMVTPDGHSRLELSRFLDPPVVTDHRTAPVDALGYLRVMFAVSDIDETLDREIFYTMREAQVLIEDWRRHHNSQRLHSALGYRPPVPEAMMVLSRHHLATGLT